LNKQAYNYFSLYTFHGKNRKGDVRPHVSKIPSGVFSLLIFHPVIRSFITFSFKNYLSLLII